MYTPRVRMSGCDLTSLRPARFRVTRMLPALPVSTLPPVDPSVRCSQVALDSGNPGETSHSRFPPGIAQLSRQHIFLFDGADMPVGVYLIRLTTGAGSFVRRVVLLK